VYFFGTTRRRRSPWCREGKATVAVRTRRASTRDVLDALLEQLGAAALVAVEGVLHVLGRDRIAVVELHARAHDELVGEPV
jgi:hypothetical protein